MTRDRSSSVLLVILLAGLVFRLSLIVPRLNTMDDPDNYLPMARSVATGHGLAINGKLTAYRPPLYPLILAPIVGIAGEYWPVGIAALHLLLGGLTIVCTWYAARAWGLGALAVAIATFLVAFDPVLAVQSRSVMTETLAAALVASSLALLAWTSQVRQDRIPLGFLLTGGMFGLAILCRPSLLPGAVLVLGCLWIGNSENRSRVLIVAVGLALPLIPWALRNVVVIGEPIFTTSHGGYTLALANNPNYYADVLDGPANSVWSGPNQQAWWDGLNARTQGMTEPQADRFLRNEALTLARERPVDFMRALWARLGRFWAIAPSAEVYPHSFRLATRLWTVPFWLAVVVGLVRKSTWKWPTNTAICMIFGLTLVHAFYWTDLRMRAPIVPALALLAAAGVSSHRLEDCMGRREVNALVPKK